MFVQTKFAKCNIVLIEDHTFDLFDLLGSPIALHEDSETGSLATYATSNPDATLSPLPRPGGRMPNYSFQKVVMKCADAFLLIMDTCDFSGSYWLDNLKRYENVPVICWIDRTREEHCIAEYKKATANSLTKQYRVQTQLQKLKDQAENESSKKVKKESRWLNNYNRRFPVADYEEVVNEIKTNLGAKTPILNFPPTGVNRNGAEPKITWDEQNLLRVREFFENSVRMCVKIQEERGILQTVLEHKQKDIEIEEDFRFGSDEMLIAEIGETGKRQKSRGFPISTLFSFGSSIEVNERIS